MTLNLPPQYQSKEKLVRLIRFLGRLYDSDIDEVEEFDKFQQTLDNVDSNKKTGLYDMREKLEMLAPKCNDMILKCKWGGMEVPCQKFFRTQLSNEGFCCTFNYVRVNDEKDKVEEARIAAGIGPDMGITVLMNLSLVDYFYPLKNFGGATALIFDPFEFPDSSSGSVREVPLEKFLETRITLSCKTKRAVEEVQRYSIDKRGCLFPTDMMSEYNGNYNYGDCLLKCKLKSIMALCKCVPFNLPINFPNLDDAKSLPYCNLANLQCMNKYEVKWGTIKPREFVKGMTVVNI